MVAIPKVVGILSCGFLLCLGLSNAAQAGNAAATAAYFLEKARKESGWAILVPLAIIIFWVRLWILEYREAKDKVSKPSPFRQV